MAAELRQASAASPYATTYEADIVPRIEDPGGRDRRQGAGARSLAAGSTAPMPPCMPVAFATHDLAFDSNGGCSFTI
jgi:hypothetical protein